jgi:hypothetical protein
MVLVHIPTKLGDMEHMGYIGNFIIPTAELHHFSEGLQVNPQPVDV